MQDTHITLAHGNGGRYMRELIVEVFARHLANDSLDVQVDAASISLESRDVIFTTDGFTVQPLEFPGGDIGSLAVHGTVNDLAVAGANPKYLSLNAFIEEGMEIVQLERIIISLANAAKQAGVKVVAGDTIMAYGISLGFSANDVKYFTTFTLMAMVATYGLGVFLIPKYINQALALKSSAVLGIVFTCCIVFTSGFTSILFVAGLGIANALVWPAVWPLTLKGLGKFTKTASALLIMAISGGAIIPLLYGKLVDGAKADLIAQGMEEASAAAEAATSGYWILLPCYFIILYYAITGHKLGLSKH